VGGARPPGHIPPTSEYGPETDEPRILDVTTMVATPSTMTPLGSLLPDFRLPEPATGRMVGPSDFQGAPGLLVMFLSNHCPFVKHLAEALERFGREYGERGLAIVAVNANDVSRYPDDSPEAMAAEVARLGYTFPYLYDESQEVAKTFRAACTPDFFLFDAAGRLVYRGQFDESRPSLAVAVTGRDLRAACDAVLRGEAPAPEQTPSIGCNIKWKDGNAPDYFG
jgi:thiol-disulfide isomerase/thioredoxin